MIFVIRGYPGSGKTTLGKKLEDKYHIIEYDEILDKTALENISHVYESNYFI